MGIEEVLARDAGEFIGLHDLLQDVAAANGKTYEEAAGALYRLMRQAQDENWLHLALLWHHVNKLTGGRLCMGDEGERGWELLRTAAEKGRPELPWNKDTPSAATRNAIGFKTADVAAFLENNGIAFKLGAHVLAAPLEPLARAEAGTLPAIFAGVVLPSELVLFTAAARIIARHTKVPLGIAHEVLERAVIAADVPVYGDNDEGGRVECLDAESRADALHHARSDRWWEPDGTMDEVRDLRIRAADLCNLVPELAEEFKGIQTAQAGAVADAKEASWEMAGADRAHFLAAELTRLKDTHAQTLQELQAARQAAAAQADELRAMRQQLAQLEHSRAQQTPEEDRRSDEVRRRSDLSTKERTTLLVLIAALAELAGIDWRKPSKAGAALEHKTQLMGARVSENAVALHLKRIPGMLEHFPEVLKLIPDAIQRRSG